MACAFARRLVCSLWAIRLQGHARAALSSASAQLTAPIMAAAMPAQAPAAVQQGYSGPSCNIFKGPCPSPSPTPSPQPPAVNSHQTFCCPTGVVDYVGKCCQSGMLSLHFCQVPSQPEDPLHQEVLLDLFYPKTKWDVAIMQQGGKLPLRRLLHSNICIVQIPIPVEHVSFK